MSCAISGKLLVAGVLSLMAATPVWSVDSIKAEYGFYWKGILVASAESGAAVTENAYDLSIDFRMRGIATWFASGQSAVKAQGVLAQDGGMTPTLYSSQGRWDGEDYAQTMTFDTDGALAEQTLDWPEEWLEDFKREPVPEDMQVGPDPASVVIKLIRAPLNDAIDGTPIVVRAFDGDSVFDWQFSCNPEMVVLEESGKSPFAGPAHECSFSADLVAGKRILTEKQQKKAEKRRKKAEKRKAKGREDEDIPPKIWVQSFADGRYMLPVRAEVSSGMGRIVMYMKNLSVDNVAPTVDAMIPAVDQVAAPVESLKTRTEK